MRPRSGLRSNPASRAPRLPAALPGTAQVPAEQLPQRRRVPGRPGPAPADARRAFSAAGCRFSPQPPPLHTSYPAIAVLPPPQPRQRWWPTGRRGPVGNAGRGRCGTEPCEPAAAHGAAQTARRGDRAQPRARPRIHRQRVPRGSWESTGLPQYLRWSRRSLPPSPGRAVSCRASCGTSGRCARPSVASTAAGRGSGEGGFGGAGQPAVGRDNF